MQRIEVIIRPSAVEEVKEVLRGHPWVSGITVTEVNGYGRQKGHAELYRGAEYVVDLVPKLKVELVVPEPLVPRLVHDLERALRTGRIGDGKLFVAPITEAIRIRTGDRGEEAL